MTYLTIGQVNIPVAWLAFLLAIFYSDFHNRKADVTTNKLIEYLVFMYILIWKFSYILFFAPDFLKSPLGIIYFDGGMRGHILALLVVAFVLYRKRQVLIWVDLWSYWARLVAMFQIINYSFQEQWLVVGLWLITLVVFNRNKGQWVFKVYPL